MSNSGLITLDFESFYGPDYGFKTHNTEEYVRDPRFEAIGFALKVNDGPARWYTGDHAYLRSVLATIDWSNSALLAHNCRFDAAVLHWIFGFKPKRYLDTLSMARGLVGLRTSLSLANLAEFFNLSTRKGDEVVNAYGKRRADFAPEQLAAYGRYCENDTELCYELAHILLARTAQKELKLQDWTLRCFVEPKLVLDGGLVAVELANYYARRERVMADAGIADIAELRSDERLAELLRGLGVDPPMKVSAARTATAIKNGEPAPVMAYAFSKQDLEFTALLDSDDEAVVALVEARLGTKSSIIESRLKRLQGMATRGPMPMPLAYAGAMTTRRWAGDDGINVQNFTRNRQLPDGSVVLSPLRQAIRVPPGMRMSSGDLSQIELRVNCWHSGQRNVLDTLASGGDEYSETASAAFGFKVDKKRNPNERFVGKTATLGCGYQCGAPRFHHMLQADARKYGIVLPDASFAFAEQVVATYRARNKNIVNFWYESQRAIESLAFGLQDRLGPYEIRDYRVWLPDGNSLYYPDLRFTESLDPTRTDGEWTYQKWDWKSRRLVRHRLFGGKLVENITQAVARAFVADAILRIESLRYENGAQIFYAVFSVHDEIVVLFDAGLDEDYVRQALTWALTERQPWAPDMPLACEIGIGDDYASCK